MTNDKNQPTDLQHPDDQWLDQVLAKAVPTYLDDQGFSDQVVTRLPKRRRFVRPLIMGSAVSLGVVSAGLVFRESTVVATILEQGLRASLNPSVLTVALGLLVGFVVFVGALAGEA